MLQRYLQLQPASAPAPQMGGRREEGGHLPGGEFQHISPEGKVGENFALKVTDRMMPLRTLTSE